jgi:hypothetical protein
MAWVGQKLADSGRAQSQGRARAKRFQSWSRGCGIVNPSRTRWARGCRGLIVACHGGVSFAASGALRQGHAGQQATGRLGCLTETPGSPTHDRPHRQRGPWGEAARPCSLGLAARPGPPCPPWAAAAPAAGAAAAGALDVDSQETRARATKARPRGRGGLGHGPPIILRHSISSSSRPPRGTWSAWATS